MLTVILLAAGVMLVLAVAAGLVLGWANVFFHVKVDPRIEAINAALPGANCGGCGFIGCNDYAVAVVEKGAPVNKCTVGGASCAANIAGIMGVEVKESWPQRPVVHCAATYDQRLKRGDYRGEPSCTAANLVSGVQGCVYGCLGLADCVRACNYDAIHVFNGLAEVDYQKCVGCGACERVCPRHIISLVPFKAERMLVVACSNRDMGLEVKAVCKVGCIGCRSCERLNKDIFKIVNNLPAIDYARYESSMDFSNVLAKCPMKRLMYVGKPTTRDLAATRDQELPKPVYADFKTSVDKTEWRG